MLLLSQLFIGLAFLGFVLFIQTRAGWMLLAIRFEDYSKRSGQTFAKESIRIDANIIPRQVDICVADEGIVIEPCGPFLSNAVPVFIPWDEVKTTRWTMLNRLELELFGQKGLRRLTSARYVRVSHRVGMAVSSRL